MRSASLWLTVILLELASAATAPAARAAEGLYLSWVDCVLAPAARHDFGYTCTGNLGQQDLYCAFRMPASADSVLGVEVMVDVVHADPALPEWWRFDPAGCRAGALVAHFDFTLKTACADFLLGQAAGDVQGYYVTQPHGAPNQARIMAAAAVLPSAGYRQLDATSMYYAARLTILNLNTVPPEAVCQGCGSPACLVLNGIIIRRQPGAAGGDVYLSTPGEDNANFATWQGGAGANCAAVPVRAVTWGRVKSLYR
jgi:hypothetical protein